MTDLVSLPAPDPDEDIDPPEVRRWQALFYLYTGLTPWAYKIHGDRRPRMPLCKGDNGEADEWIMCCGCVLDGPTGEEWLKSGAVAEGVDERGRRCLIAGHEGDLQHMITLAWEALLEKERAA
jgi:hypothetical protein